jgi:hypothetical protein
VLVFTGATGVAVVLAARGIESGVGTGVEGTVVVDIVGVTGCVIGDDVHPAKNAVSNNSPHTMPVMMIGLVFMGLFLMNCFIA